MTRLLFVLLVSLSPSLLRAQDVCCVLGKTADGGAETQATVRAASDCKAGSVSGEFKVCAALPDEENLCPTLSAEERCRKCGFHWNGVNCMAEDPVKKAKRELEEKAAKEKAAAETAVPTAPAAPK